ncbi:hypothetical protein [Streptomyces sp. NPDC058657]|uniref:hypothetical protein n=1 Tax=unclassified Streptomyces TaxID=2593676 RepID=UPI00364A624C
MRKLYPELSPKKFRKKVRTAGATGVASTAGELLTPGRAALLTRGWRQLPWLPCGRMTLAPEHARVPA